LNGNVASEKLQKSLFCSYWNSRCNCPTA
jgi:hypothetical protein